MKGAHETKLRKNVKKDTESLDFVNVCTILKNENTPKNAKNNLGMLIIKISTGEGPAFTLSLPEVKVALCPLSFKPLTLMCLWLSFQTKEALVVAFKQTSYVNDKRLLYLMAIFRSVLDSTRVLALC